MQLNLFAQDNTEEVAKRVRTQLNEFKAYGGRITSDYIWTTIREVTSVLSPELKFHDRIKFVEKVYDYIKEDK